VGKSCTPAELALAWVLAQVDDFVPIPGTKRRKYLEENVKALNLELSPEDVKQLVAALLKEWRWRECRKHGKAQSRGGRSWACWGSRTQDQRGGARRERGARRPSSRTAKSSWRR
jgi:hypothetical protein